MTLTRLLERTLFCAFRQHKHCTGISVAIDGRVRVCRCACHPTPKERQDYKEALQASKRRHPSNHLRLVRSEGDHHGAS